MDTVFSKNDAKLITRNIRLPFDARFHADFDLLSVVRYSDLSKESQIGIKNALSSNAEEIKDSDNVVIGFSEEWGHNFKICREGTDVYKDWYAGADIDDPQINKIWNNSAKPLLDKFKEVGNMKIPDNIYESLGIEKPEEKPEKETSQLYSDKAKKDAFVDASQENPIYATVRVRGSQYNAREDRTDRYSIETEVAIEGIKRVTVEGDTRYDVHEEDRLEMLILDDAKPSNPRVEPFERGSGLNKQLGDVDVIEIHERTPELDKKYQDAINSREYDITGAVYPEMNLTNLRGYEAHCEGISVKPYETKYHVKGLRSIEDADKWLLENHPAEFLGSGVVSNKGDWSAKAIPSAYFEDQYEGEQTWGTHAAQEAKIREIAARMGVTPGEFDWSLAEPSKPYIIDCKLYGNEYHESKGYDVIDHKIMKTSALTLNDAKKELLEKHPDYYLGAEIKDDDKVVQSIREPRYNETTINSRYEIAKAEAARIGATVGESELLKSKDNKAKITACMLEGERATEAVDFDTEFGKN